MSVSNINKSATATVTNLSKNNASPMRYGKGGAGWLYDQNGITYDGEFDSVTGLPVNYDSLGTTPVITNLAKNNA